jgi:uncharacterized protein (DUF2249 family)
VASASGEASEREAFSAYQAIRDHLSMPLLTTVDEIGAFRWDETEIGPLLIQASSAMAAEVDAIAAFDPVAVS